LQAQETNVPDDYFFQVVTEHIAGVGLVGPSMLLRIEHSKDLMSVQITCAEGRTVGQKKALYVSIVEKQSTAPGVRKEDVIINLVETKRENWSFGNGGAPFAAH
jgi:4-oxalocrotonate tautomerase